MILLTSLTLSIFPFVTNSFKLLCTISYNANIIIINRVTINCNTIENNTTRKEKKSMKFEVV